MYQKTLTLILAFSTLFFLGYGMTGFAMLDSDSPVPVVQQAEQSYIAVVLGVLLLVILGIVGYFEWQQEKNGKRKNVRRARVKK